MLVVGLATCALVTSLVPTRVTTRPPSRLQPQWRRAALVVMGPVEPDEAWTTTGSGLKYLDTAMGDGEAPASGAVVTVGYTGWTMDGKVFDSGSISFAVGTGRVIPGWDEGILSMRVGGSRKLYVPSNLGYGSEGAGEAIPPDAPLFFECELKEISSGFGAFVKTVPGAHSLLHTRPSHCPKARRLTPRARRSCAVQAAMPPSRWACRSFHTSFPRSSNQASSRRATQGARLRCLN